MDDATPNFYSILEKRISSHDVLGFHFKPLSFGRYLLYNKRKKDFLDSNIVVDRLNQLLSIFDLCQVDINKVDVIMLPILINKIDSINFCNSVFEWQKPIDERQTEFYKEELNINYEGREIAGMISLLASVYGWTSQYVLDELLPEEVFAYYQEAVISQHAEQKFTYSMSSDVGVEKQGSDYVKKPFPSIPWIKKKVIPNPALSPKKFTGVRAEFEPDGVVIDLTKAK